MNSPRNYFSRKSIGITVLILLVSAGLAYGTFFSYSTYQTLKGTQTELTITIQSSQDAIEALEARIEEFTLENEKITGSLTEEQKKNLGLEKLKTRNERKIDTLEKLTTIDPELLKKYSKVFFLSENYAPPELEDVEEKYKITADKELRILEDIDPFLHTMLKAAERSGANLRVISAYRSYETQMKLKSSYTATYGSGANQFSADQGYSEHQLGTTLDFGTPEIRGAYMSFENTPEFKWLTKNAHLYGFIMSYPKSNSYYQYEPWHWRFVGRDLAEDLFDKGMNFYDMDQREIDKYLIRIFD